MAFLSEKNIEVEIAYALSRHQFLQRITVPSGITVEQAITLSEFDKRFPDIDWVSQKIGIFGKLTTLDAVLQNNDRVEIYRPLQCDPKENRRIRYKKKTVRLSGI
ncbi:MAG TPA: RnfH family protein [Nitrosomonas sp.]|nr:RnfH family protein [Nitrosomonas sp.]HMW20261.1 RnfH family protein [Nitrosomonas sp.]HMW69308.1 RnfH family protein [Nitrosomonas sp.]HMY60470.1 RnfH family protein [Nitrosomonas sp.]HMY90301.1 RnfH family protein [Nitrosomonas sp.]